MKKLPKEVQKLFSASTCIHSYRRAVEELVYNAVDAGSTSIAIRLNLKENCMQVIDNGCGIRKNDMKLVGLKYTTSKTVDLSSLKSTSNAYGYRGQALASIAEVSEEVKITSRCESDETMVKTFCCGNVAGISNTNIRPSKGTTVEIKGFLYNLHIQKNNIDFLQEIKEIKQFLEQLSMVHNNISISLRDDSNNEIIFQVHKSRDIYQTLQTLFGIDRSHCKELKVEKKLYKVTAFIGNKISEENENHWIYLNGRHLRQSKLHKVFDDEMSKVLGLKNGKNKTNKLGFDRNNSDNQVFKKIPFYFLFIKCPYNDYDLNNTEHKTILEFKKWESVTTLLEKLAKFYIGDVGIKKNEDVVEQKGKDTRDEVKKIVEKFLGNIARKPGVSQMQNGVQGRLMKRNKTKKANISLSKVIPGNSGKKPKAYCKKLNVTNHDETNNKTVQVETVKKTRRLIAIAPKPTANSKNKTYKSKKIIKNKTIKDKALKDKGEIKNGLVKLFEMDNSQVKRKCKQAADKANELLRNKMRGNKLDIKNTVQYSITQTDIRTVSVRNTIREVARDIEAFKKPIALKRTIKDVPRKEYKSNYDLLQTILKTQSNSDVNSVVPYENTDNDEQNYTDENKLTFQSHHYNIKERLTMGHKTVQTRRSRFITTESRENFASKHVFRCPRPIKRHQPYSKWNGKRNIFNGAQESSYTIEFNDTNKENQLDFKTREVCVESNILNTVLSQVVSGNAFNLSNTKHTVLETTVNHNKFGDVQNTYTVDILNSSEVNDHDSFQQELRIDPSHVIDHETTLHELSINPSEVNNYGTTSHHFRIRNNTVDHQVNVEFISNTNEDSLALEPLNVCETLLNDSNHDERSEQDINSFAIDDINCRTIMIDNGNDNANLPFENVDGTEIMTENNMVSIPIQVPSTEDLIETSNHFQLGKTIEEELLNEFVHNFTGQRVNKSKEVSMETFNKSGNVYQIHKKTGMTFGGNNRGSKIGDFNITDRPGFMPKGLSPIFENCQTKNACNYDLASEYFNDSMYNDFVKDIEQQTEIFEANIQNFKELATKHIEKVNNKLKKDNASLSFDGACLKEAIILGQVDSKFIAAKMKGNTNSEHLVLFDQHAVHERIRLENNMTEYLTNDQWKSVPLDEIIIKLKTEEIIYVHNYRHKFAQLGLKWTVVDERQLSVHGIPFGILGKNPRQVEVIMKAVKSLIQEEIQTLKMQKGSLCLYPKAIMELVFSEACRYAIKFGDPLSLKQCKGLLQDLSTCRVPFQCAHGRPVMAVLLDIGPNGQEFKINYNKLKRFKQMFVK